jgi:IS5 family transposase
VQFAFHPGNKNDCKTLGHLLNKTKLHTNVDNCQLYADKIYDTAECKSILNIYNLQDKISKKRTTPPKEDNRVRIVVEHTFGWLDKYRRILVRFDQRVAHFRSFHYLAANCLLTNRIKK